LSVFIFKFKELDQITVEEFKKILPKVWKEEDAVDELRKAFDVFDPTNNGYFTIEQLKKILTELGENLDDGEFKELLKNTTVQPDDTINVDGI